MTTHGYSKSGIPEYVVWKSMRQRCNAKPGTKNYEWYSSRGIKVCERWNDFVKFYKDMGPRPSDRHSIERIDNDGNYEPENCKWATNLEQRLNKRLRKDNKSGVQGVNRQSVGGGWNASIRIDNKPIWLGTYPTKAIASDVYNAALLVYLETIGDRNENGET